MAENDIASNSEKAHTFLKEFRSKGLINLVTIDPHSENIGGITRPVCDQDISSFIKKNNGKRNLYFMVNTPKDGAPDTKLKKEHIKEINAVWLDADPDKDKPFDDERKRLLKFAKELAQADNPPTYIVDSGGGIQAFWLIDEPLDVANDEGIKDIAESLSRGLAKKYGTDNVHNVDRIMRLPYTVNIPTKRKKDRKPALARYKKTGKNYPNLSFITPVHAAVIDDDFSDAELDMDMVKAPACMELREKLKHTCNRVKKIKDLLCNTTDTKQGDRSDRDFTLAKELKLSGFSLQEVGNILWHFPHGKVQSVKNPRREIIRCYMRSGNDFADAISPAHLALIAAQTNPILKARAAGKPLEEDLDQSARFRAVELHKMNWLSSGRPIYVDFLYDRAITVVYGRSNTGKSFFTTDLAGHVALGRDWNGMKFKAKTPPAVLYICAEAGNSFGIRGKALIQKLGVDKLPFFVITEAPGFVDEDKKDTKAILAEIKRLEKAHSVKIGLVVVDTLAVTFTGGNENSSEDMGNYISNMKYIQHQADVGVLIVHHSGKDQAAGARGSSALQAATDTEIEVKSDKKGDRYIRQIEVKKQREGKNGMIVKFGLGITELARDEDNDPIDTCYVVLEDDSEFEDVTPAWTENLSLNELSALHAIYLYNKHQIHPNMDQIRSRNFTEKELKALFLNDIAECNNVIIMKDNTIDFTQLKAMAKPVRGILKKLETAWSNISDRDVEYVAGQYTINDVGNKHLKDVFCVGV